MAKKIIYSTINWQRKKRHNKPKALGQFWTFQLTNFWAMGTANEK